mmetsp:Transcript_13935/g.39621  ORF Transcript_13935/g.39621 Transcript_13935/m.39621 type:complete len:200 (-) Transcript_13935:597-1196(-)
MVRPPQRLGKGVASLARILTGIHVLEDLASERYGFQHARRVAPGGGVRLAGYHVVVANRVVIGVPQCHGLLQIGRALHDVAEANYPGESAEGLVLLLQVGFVDRNPRFVHTRKNSIDRQESDPDVGDAAVRGVPHRDGLVGRDAGVGSVVEIAARKQLVVPSAGSPDGIHTAFQRLDFTKCRQGRAHGRLDGPKVRRPL